MVLKSCKQPKIEPDFTKN